MVCVNALSQSPKGKDTLLDLPAMLGYTTCEAGSRLSRGIHISGIPCPPRRRGSEHVSSMELGPCAGRELVRWRKVKQP